jgi:hypothetical protein
MVFWAPYHGVRQSVRSYGWAVVVLVANFDGAWRCAGGAVLLVAGFDEAPEETQANNVAVLPC